MARSSSYFGLRTGSTKSHTFSVLKGVQITKDRVLNVANPSTDAQRVQRVLLNTVAQAYSAMQEIVDHSWQGVAYGADTQAVFQSVNINKMRRELAAAGQYYGELKCFAPLRTPYLAPNSYVMSHGSLTPAAYTMGQTLMIPFCETYEEACKAIGCKQGDQITICGMLGNPDGSYRFVYARCIMQPQDEQGRNVPMASLFFADDGEGIQLPNRKNEATDAITLQTSDDGSHLEILADGQEFACACIIISRRHGKRWLRSSATMVVNPFVIGTTLNEAISPDNYEVPIQPQPYLNEAGTNANIVDANVTNVMVNIQPLQNGATYDNPCIVAIAGSNLIEEQIEVRSNAQKVLPIGVSSTGISYMIQSAGLVTVHINGISYGSFFVEDAVPRWDVQMLHIGQSKTTELGKTFTFSRGSRFSCAMMLNEWPTGGFADNKFRMSNQNGLFTNLYKSESEKIVSWDIQLTSEGSVAFIYDNTIIAMFNVL